VEKRGKIIFKKRKKGKENVRNPMKNQTLMENFFQQFFISSDSADVSVATFARTCENMRQASLVCLDRDIQIGRKYFLSTNIKLCQLVSNLNLLESCKE